MDTVVNEGKTKIIRRVSNTVASISSKNDLTAGNGAKHDVMEGKAAYANETTSRVFELLKSCGVPVAYMARESETSFLAQLCRMLPWEVVTRRYADGSYLKRNPSVTKGTKFDKILLEFYLKTKDRRWNQYGLPCDDPLALISPDGCVDLYVPNIEFDIENYFLRLKPEEVFEKPEDFALLEEMGDIAIDTFLILEHAWSLLRYQLVDEKVEFGVSMSGELLLADVIDNDSWRLLRNGQYVDKQGYRDGEDLITTKGNYQLVANASKSLTPSTNYMKVWIDEHLLHKT